MTSALLRKQTDDPIEISPAFVTEYAARFDDAFEIAKNEFVSLDVDAL